MWRSILKSRLPSDSRQSLAISEDFERNENYARRSKNEISSNISDHPVCTNTTNTNDNSSSLGNPVDDDFNDGSSKISYINDEELNKLLKKDNAEIEKLLSKYKCYHADIKCRKDAVEKLKNTKKDGVFLLRTSSSKADSFVLSFTFKRKVLHYQVRLIGRTYQLQDCSESNSYQNVNYGLNGLISSYMQQPVSTTTCLSEASPNGSSLPPLTLHTTFELTLHKAIRSNDSKLALRILSHRLCPHVDYRTPNGSTALHLASEGGSFELVNALLLMGASVEATDDKGFTPLHLACQFNHEKVIFLLLRQGRASSQTATSLHGDVALHICTKERHVDALRVLLKCHVPCFPRNHEHLTPYEIAVKDGFNVGISMFDDYKAPDARARRENWFHENIKTRKEAIDVLQNHVSTDGCFIIRKQSSNDDKYVLDVCYQNAIQHFVIETCMSSVFLSMGPLLPSLEHLVDYYSVYSDGLPSELTAGVSSAMKLVPLKKEMLPFEDSTSKDSNHKQTVHYSDPLVLNPDNLEIGSELGHGEYGSVMKGSWKLFEGKTISVAVKTLHEEHSQANEEAFLREAKLMLNLQHPFIVKLIGICQSPKLMLVQELLPMGSLLDFLLDQSEKIDVTKDIPLWAEQVACGMLYLEKQSLVHRDLAARNILLSTKSVAKISDFGLSRALSSNDYYRAGKGGKWPIKWYAPESILYGTFSSRSDVWSYGVTVWEMYSMGTQPYEEMEGTQVLTFLEEGERLERPKDCPPEVYTLMLCCWNSTTKLRPDFEGIFYSVYALRLACTLDSPEAEKTPKNRKNLLCFMGK